MSELFPTPAEVPPAEALRPASLDGISDQQHPPGVGKTPLARLMADSFDAGFIAPSAVFSGVKDIRAAVARVEVARAQHGRHTILFVDEMPCFNRYTKTAAKQSLASIHCAGLVPHYNLQACKTPLFGRVQHG